MTDAIEEQVMEPIRVLGREQELFRAALADGGIPPVVGVHSFCVFRASRDAAELTDGRGWTYHHHVDMAAWRGRLYVGWNSCEKDEDIWPSRELYSTSADGSAWTEPAEMFPQGISTPLRMYFYHASNGRMLVIAGMRGGTGEITERTKDGLVVREIGAGHELGEVYVLQGKARRHEGTEARRGEGKRHEGVGTDRHATNTNHHLSSFEESGDEGFIAACRELLGDTVFLEQQDYGRLLGERRMKWHDPGNWPGGEMPGTGAGKWVFGKGHSFYRRPDGVWVGVSKMGWVVMSSDEGRTWTAPVVPPTLVTGKAKVWSQRTGDGGYALVYNPTPSQRWPLVVVTGEDGVTFSGMRIVHGEMPIQRYEGRFRSVGPQYVRGISHWADDGSREDVKRAMWLVYSQSKEDIWVSRVPLPVRGDEDLGEVGGFDEMEAGPWVEGWNVYRPKWGNVSVVDLPEGGRGLELEDRDPYDYVRVVRVFRESRKVRVGFEVQALQTDRGWLEVELMGGMGSPRPVRVAMKKWRAGEWVKVEIEADAGVEGGRYSVMVDGERTVNERGFAEAAAGISRISLRTGGWRGVGGLQPVPPPTDRPHEALRWRVRGLRVMCG
jgi:hypothetical protein